MSVKKTKWVWIQDAPSVLKEKYGIHIKKHTLDNWRFAKKYPDLFSKLGGKVYIDVDVMLRILEENRAKENEKRKRMTVWR